MSERIATVFGGTGFLGHAVVQALAARGYQVRVITRDLDKAADLKLMGAVGQITPILANVRLDAAVLDLVIGSDVVINMVGALFETRDNSFQSTHVETAARLARAAKAAGVPQLIHVSALGAEMNAKARYARTKAIGEEAVRAFYPGAVILRPSIMFGPRDTFFNKFALMARYMPFLPLIGGGHTKFQPVYVGDVAAAITTIIGKTKTSGQSYNLGGARIYSFRELLEKICHTTGHCRWLLPVPWWLARIKAMLFELMPNPVLTRDQVELLKTDNVVPVPSHAASVQRSTVGTLADLGIHPTAQNDIMPKNLG